MVACHVECLLLCRVWGFWVCQTLGRKLGGFWCLRQRCWVALRWTVLCDFMLRYFVVKIKWEVNSFTASFWCLPGYCVCLVWTRSGCWSIPLLVRFLILPVRNSSNTVMNFWYMQIEVNYLYRTLHTVLCYWGRIQELFVYLCTVQNEGNISLLSVTLLCFLRCWLPPGLLAYLFIHCFQAVW